MPQHIAHARQIQGHHANHLARQLSRVPPALALPDRLNGAGPLHIRNRPADHLIAALLFSTALSQLRLPEAPPRRQQAQPPRAGLDERSGLRPSAVRQPLPRHPGLGVHASPSNTYTPMENADGSTAQLLNHVGNSVLTTCAVKPAQCTRAALAGAASAAAILAAGGLGYLAGSRANPPCISEPQPVADAMPSVHTLLNTLPPEDRQQVWEIVRACNGDPDCAIPEIHTLLEQLPPALQQRLAALVPAENAEEVSAAGWPSGVDAAVVPPGVDWMDHLSTLLGLQISAEEAAFELDVAAIVDATRTSQERAGSFVKQRYAANQARLQAIVDLFERDGRSVEVRSFNLTTRTEFGFPYQSSGQNLLVTLQGAEPTQRTLMLVAHGDVTGADTGGTGAVDNAGGVAALLELARRLAAEGLPDGTRVQFLVTDQEEVGLHGAKAYVEQCREAGDCPDATLNLDLIAQGNGMTLSGSAEHSLYRDGDSRPRGLDATAVSPAEAQLARLLRTAAADIGLRVHDTGNWTLQSDHLAFQRQGLPALGISLMDDTDIGPEQARQQARDTFLQAEEHVDWDKYDAWMANTLNTTEAAEFARRMGRADATLASFKDLPLSGRERTIHGAADQPERIETAHALAAINALHRGMRAWLAAPLARGEA